MKIHAHCSAYGDFFNTDIEEVFSVSFPDLARDTPLPKGYDYNIVNINYPDSPYEGQYSYRWNNYPGIVFYNVEKMAKEASEGVLKYLGREKVTIYSHIINEGKDDYIEDIVISPDELENALTQCATQINTDKNTLKIKYFAILFGILIGLFILFFILKKLIKVSKEKAPEAADKYKSTVKKYKSTVQKFKDEKHAQKVRDIAEEESIRTSVKKSINDSDKNELEDLQDVINDALAKGDTATAQALLKILNKNKKK
ncbi:MAG: hypothetical protein KAI79_15230 [Bacteroidales bacterium]|nr:hypothetical protein [Bacteroidales bacterium]